MVVNVVSRLLKLAVGGVFAALLLKGLLGGAAAQAADSPIVVHVDGEALDFNIEPNLQAGTTLVQMRPIFEALGLALIWDPSTRSITATKEGYTLSMTLGSDIATVNGQQVKLARPAAAVDGHTIVPLRFVGEATGAFVHWNGVGREILVMSEAYMANLGMTRAEVEDLMDELQRELDEEHARKVAETKEKEAVAKSEPKPLIKVDESKLQGMFYGFENDFGGYECGGMCWRFYTFLPDSQVVVGEPAGGGPETINCKVDACLTYSIKDGQLHMTGQESLSIGQTEEGVLVINDAYLSKAEPVADRYKLDGTYVTRGYQGFVGITPFSSSWTKYLTFYADGTFESDSTSLGILDTGSSHTSGTVAPDTVKGTYHINDNTITLNYPDGTTAKHVFILDNEGDLQIGDNNYSLATEE